MYLIYNGNIIEEKNFSVGFNNRAFNYGDGIFETLIATPDQIFYLNDHLKRLSSGIEAISITLPQEINYNTIEDYIKQLIQVNNQNNTIRVKIIVWRNPGGLFSPSNNSAEFLISTQAQSSASTAKEKVFFYDEIKLSYSKISRFKTLSSLPYVMAGIAKNNLKADDLILLDTNNNIAECIASNIFWIKENIVYTPSMETGCKDGIIRKQIISFLNANNIKWEEGKYPIEHLLNAVFIFNCNVAGTAPILRVEGKEFNKENEIFSKLKKALSLY